LIGKIQGARPRNRRRGGRRCALPCVVPAVLALLLPHAARARPEDPWFTGRLRVAVGLDYRSGDYGSEFGATKLLSVPVSVEYRFERLPFSPGDRLRLRVTVPYLRVDGPFRGEASETGGTGVDEGVGDVYLWLSYFYSPPWPKLPFAELGAGVKFPTADADKNLGTGEFDYALALRLMDRFPIGDLVLTPFASVGYRFIGDPPGEKRNDTWRAGAGVSLRIDDGWALGARYSVRESSIPGRTPRHEIGPFVNVRVNDRFSLVPYAVAGLSEWAPNWAVGFQLRWDTLVH